MFLNNYKSSNFVIGVLKEVRALLRVLCGEDSSGIM